MNFNAGAGVEVTPSFATRAGHTEPRGAAGRSVVNATSDEAYQLPPAIYSVTAGGSDPLTDVIGTEWECCLR